MEFITQNNTTMTTTDKTTEIIEAIASKAGHRFDAKAYDQVTDRIVWAWENWDAKVLATYYTGEKPEEPTYEFRKQWIETELEQVPENYTDLIESFKG